MCSRTPFPCCWNIQYDKTYLSSRKKNISESDKAGELARQGSNTLYKQPELILCIKNEQRKC